MNSTTYKHDRAERFLIWFGGSMVAGLIAFAIYIRFWS